MNVNIVVVVFHEQTILLTHACVVGFWRTFSCLLNDGLKLRLLGFFYLFVFGMILNAQRYLHFCLLGSSRSRKSQHHGRVNESLSRGR